MADIFDDMLGLNPKNDDNAAQAADNNNDRPRKKPAAKRTGNKQATPAEDQTPAETEGGEGEEENGTMDMEVDPGEKAVRKPVRSKAVSRSKKAVADRDPGNLKVPAPSKQKSSHNRARLHTGSKSARVGRFGNKRRLQRKDTHAISKYGCRVLLRKGDGIMMKGDLVAFTQQEASDHLTDLMKHVLALVDHAKRSTITAGDVKYAWNLLHENKTRFYAHETDLDKKDKQKMFRFKKKKKHSEE